MTFFGTSDFESKKAILARTGLKVSFASRFFKYLLTRGSRTPLLQISLPFFFIQKNLKPLLDLLLPDFGHCVPGCTAETELPEKI